VLPGRDKAQQKQNVKSKGDVSISKMQVELTEAYTKQQQV